MWMKEFTEEKYKELDKATSAVCDFCAEHFSYFDCGICPVSTIDSCAYDKAKEAGFAEDI